MSVSFLLIYYNQTYKDAVSIDSPFSHHSRMVRKIKNLSRRKTGCIKNKFLLKSVLMNYLNK